MLTKITNKKKRTNIRTPTETDKNVIWEITFHVLMAKLNLTASVSEYDFELKPTQKKNLELFKIDQKQ